MPAKPATTPKRPHAYVYIYREEVLRGDYRDDAIIGEGGFVIQGDTMARYYAGFAFSDTEMSPDAEVTTEPFIPPVEVNRDPEDEDAEPDPLSPVATLRNSGTLADEEAAHRQIWEDAEEYLQELGYRKFTYVDDGVLGLNTTSGTRVLTREKV